jgi:hypothetical protein
VAAARVRYHLELSGSGRRDVKKVCFCLYFYLEIVIILIDNNLHIPSQQGIFDDFFNLKYFCSACIS